MYAQESLPGFCNQQTLFGEDIINREPIQNAEIEASEISRNVAQYALFGAQIEEPLF